MFKNWFKRKPKAIWHTKYIMKLWYGPDPGKGRILVYLNQDQFGNRKIVYQGFGLYKRNPYAVAPTTQQELALWMKFGIVPKDAEDLVQIKLQS